jgi:hypothetical protein
MAQPIQMLRRQNTKYIDSSGEPEGLASKWLRILVSKTALGGSSCPHYEVHGMGAAS